MFGPEFDPIVMPNSAARTFVINFVAMFYNGGDYKRMRALNGWIKWLKLAQNPELKELTWEELDFLMHIWEDIGAKDKLTKYEGKLDKPVHRSELAISGDELISLGYKGQMIGKILRAVLDEVSSGNLENDKETLMLWVQDEF